MNYRKSLFAIVALVLGSANAQQQIPEVEELLQKMTIDEKIGQLNLLTPGGGVATRTLSHADRAKRRRTLSCLSPACTHPSPY